MSWTSIHLRHQERSSLTRSLHHWRPHRCNLQHQHTGPPLWSASLLKCPQSTWMKNVTEHHLPIRWNTTMTFHQLIFWCRASYQDSLECHLISSWALLEQLLGIPLCHQISGWGVPDAAQASTAASPAPTRTWLNATVTTGDSSGREPELEWAGSACVNVWLTNVSEDGAHCVCPCQVAG